MNNTDSEILLEAFDHFDDVILETILTDTVEKVCIESKENMEAIGTYLELMETDYEESLKYDDFFISAITETFANEMTRYIPMVITEVSSSKQQPSKKSRNKKQPQPPPNQPSAKPAPSKPTRRKKQATNTSANQPSATPTQPQPPPNQKGISGMKRPPGPPTLMQRLKDWKSGKEGPNFYTAVKDGFNNAAQYIKNKYEPIRKTALSGLGYFIRKLDERKDNKQLKKGHKIKARAEKLRVLDPVNYRQVANEMEQTGNQLIKQVQSNRKNRNDKRAENLQNKIEKLDKHIKMRNKLIDNNANYKNELLKLKEVGIKNQYNELISPFTKLRTMIKDRVKEFDIGVASANSIVDPVQQKQARKDIIANFNTKSDQIKAYKNDVIKPLISEMTRKRRDLRYAIGDIDNERRDIEKAQKEKKEKMLNKLEISKNKMEERNKLLYGI